MIIVDLAVEGTDLIMHHRVTRQSLFMLRGRAYTFVFRSYLILLQPSLRVLRAETRLTVYRPLQV